MARVALSFDAWKPGAVKPASVEVPVQVPEASPSPQLVATLKGHEDGVWQVAWAPDGKTLVSLSSPRGADSKSEIKIWDVAERKERTTLRPDLGAVYRLAFAPDGRQLIAGYWKNDAKAGPTGGIALWDLASGQRQGLLQHSPPRGVTQLALSPDGKTVAAREGWKEGEQDAYKSCVTLWDLAGGKEKASIPDESVYALAFSSDGKVLARAVYVRQADAVEVRRRDCATGKDLALLPNPAKKGVVASLSFSPDGRTLAGVDPEGQIILWDTAQAKVRATFKPEDGRGIAALAFSPDGKTLAAAVGDRPGRSHEPGLVVLWDVSAGRPRLTLSGHTNAVSSVAFSPDGKLLASGSPDRTVRLWDVTALPPAREK
jgi:WD40 repeat protein